MLDYRSLDWRAKATLRRLMIGGGAGEAAGAVLQCQRPACIRIYCLAYLWRVKNNDWLEPAHIGDRRWDWRNDLYTTRYLSCVALGQSLGCPAPINTQWLCQITPKDIATEYCSSYLSGLSKVTGVGRYICGACIIHTFLLTECWGLRSRDFLILESSLLLQ